MLIDFTVYGKAFNEILDLSRYEIIMHVRYRGSHPLRKRKMPDWSQTEVMILNSSMKHEIFISI